MPFIRTCQECNYKLVSSPPSQDKELTNSYRNRKCPKCKSEGSFDYGSNQRDSTEPDPTVTFDPDFDLD